MKLISCNGEHIQPLKYHHPFLNDNNSNKGSLLDDTEEKYLCASCLITNENSNCPYCSKYVQVIKIWCTPRGRGRSKQEASSVPEFSLKHFDGKMKYMLSMWSHFNRSPVKLLPDTNFNGQIYDGYIQSFILSLCLQIFTGYSVCKLPSEDNYIHVFDSRVYKLTKNEKDTLQKVFMSLRVKDACFFQTSSLPVFTHHYHNTLWTPLFISNVTSFDLHAVFNQFMDSRERSGQTLQVKKNAKRLFDIESLEETFTESFVETKKNLVQSFEHHNRILSRSGTPEISSKTPSIQMMANSTQQGYNDNQDGGWFLTDSNINLYDVDYSNMDGSYDCMFSDSPLKKTTHTGGYKQNSSNDITSYIPPFIPANLSLSLDNIPSMIENEWTMNTFIQSLIVEKNFRFINRRLQNFFEESFGNLSQVNYIALKKFIIMVVPENIICPEAGCNFIKKFMLKLV